MPKRRDCEPGSGIFRDSIRGAADEQVLSDLADWGEGLPCRVGNRRRKRDTALYLDLLDEGVCFAFISDGADFPNGAFIRIHPGVIRRRVSTKWKPIREVAGTRETIDLSSLTPDDLEKLRNALADAYESA